MKNKKIVFLLVSLVVLDILDGDFNNVSILDSIKIILYVVCFTLLIWKNRKTKT